MPQDTKRREPPDDPRPFWERKALAEMSDAEWEALCDGCGRCCLIKLEDIDTGALAFTDVACRLLDTGTCRCQSYETRQEHVPDCVKFDASSIQSLEWMPPTCAYRRLAQGLGLSWWHPLISGDPETVEIAGVSVRNRVVGESAVATEDLEDHVVSWPDEDIS